jgi:amino acid permease
VCNILIFFTYANFCSHNIIIYVVRIQPLCEEISKCQDSGTDRDSWIPIIVLQLFMGCLWGYLD